MPRKASTGRGRGKAPGSQAALAAGRQSFKKGDPRLKERKKPRQTALSGRPPKDWAETWRTMTTRAEVIQAAQAILQDPTHPQWAAVMRWASEQGHGKVPDKAEHRVEVVIRDESSR